MEPIGTDYDELKARYDEMLKSETELRNNLKSLNAVHEEKQTRYYELKFENEELRKAIDREFHVTAKLSKKTTVQLNGFQQEVEGVVDEMDGVLKKFSSVKEADEAMVVRTFKQCKEIPKMFSDDILLKHVAEVDQKISETEREIEKENEDLLRFKEKYNAESTSQDLANLTLFTEELKMNNIKLRSKKLMTEPLFAIK